MKYQDKLKHAKEAAENMLNGSKSIEEIKNSLSGSGLSENNITEVLISMRSFIAESLQPIIRQKLLAKESLENVPELSQLDNDTLARTIDSERKAIKNEEASKLAKMLKDGKDPQEALKQINLDFYPRAEAEQKITSFLSIKKHNSGGGRMLRIAGGIGLIVLTGVIAVVSDRIFYVLPFIGLGMIGSAFFTKTEER